MTVTKTLSLERLDRLQSGYKKSNNDLIGKYCLLKQIN